MSGRPSVTLFTTSTAMPASASTRAVPRVATSSNPRSTRSRANSRDAGFVRLFTLSNARPPRGSFSPLASVRLRERFGEAVAHAHHFAGRFHFRAENRIRAGKLVEREHRFFDADVVRDDLAGEALRFERRSGHAARRNFRQRNADALRHERHGARRARIHFEHEDADPAARPSARSSARPRRVRSPSPSPGGESRPECPARVDTAAANTPSRQSAHRPARCAA